MTNILITAWEKEALEEEYLCGYRTHDISAAVIVIIVIQHSYFFRIYHYGHTSKNNTDVGKSLF